MALGRASSEVWRHATLINPESLFLLNSESQRVQANVREARLFAG